MMKKRFLWLLPLFFSLLAYGQVGINTKTPHSSAALDISSTTQGLLIPRMTTVQKTQITGPASGLLVYDTDSKCISQNVGTSASTSWVCLSARNNQNKFFYMPSISIDASTVTPTGTVLSLDLYGEHKKQFDGTATTFKASTGAPSAIPYFPLKTSLYYYITEYDNTVVKINSIDANGLVKYQILKEAYFNTFMNVVFVISDNI